jgi:hypothetical protein
MTGTLVGGQSKKKGLQRGVDRIIVLLRKPRVTRSIAVDDG